MNGQTQKLKAKAQLENTITKCSHQLVRENEIILKDKFRKMPQNKSHEDSYFSIQHKAWANHHSDQNFCKHCSLSFRWHKSRQNSTKLGIHQNNVLTDINNKINKPHRYQTRAATMTTRGKCHQLQTLMQNNFKMVFLTIQQKRHLK